MQVKLAHLPARNLLMKALALDYRNPGAGRALAKGRCPTGDCQWTGSVGVRQVAQGVGGKGCGDGCEGRKEKKESHGLATRDQGCVARCGRVKSNLRHARAT